LNPYVHKFHINMQKNFIIKMTEHWNRLTKVVVEPPSVEIFKTHLDTYRCDLLQGICFSRGVGLNDLLRSLPTSVIL